MLTSSLPPVHVSNLLLSVIIALIAGAAGGCSANAPRLQTMPASSQTSREGLGSSSSRNKPAADDDVSDAVPAVAPLPMTAIARTEEFQESPQIYAVEAAAAPAEGIRWSLEGEYL